MEKAGLSEKEVSVRTVRRYLHKQGYHYLQARKKGLLTEKDLKLRCRFARMMKKKYSKEVWTEDIAFYLDGVSLFTKQTLQTRPAQRKAEFGGKKCEGTSFGCTAKGRKEDTGGRLVKLFVAISHRKGVIQCTQYDHLDEDKEKQKEKEARKQRRKEEKKLVNQKKIKELRKERQESKKKLDERKRENDNNKALLAKQQIRAKHIAAKLTRMSAELQELTRNMQRIFNNERKN
ncbi:hypothetical protein ACROYT_G014537 [Oculina patagonica]